MTPADVPQRLERTARRTEPQEGSAANQPATIRKLAAPQYWDRFDCCAFLIAARVAEPHAAARSTAPLTTAGAIRSE